MKMRPFGECETRPDRLLIARLRNTRRCAACAVDVSDLAMEPPLELS